MPRRPPLISVVVPTYNGERHLASTVESALAQDCTAAFEVIVVDDGSTDRSAEIAAALPVRLLRRPHEGAGAARNAGIAAARGELVALLDHDDLWLPSKLTRQVEAVSEHPGAVVTTAMSYHVDPEIERPSWLPPAEFEAVPSMALPSTWLIPRGVLDAVGVFDTSITICDADWLMRAREANVEFVKLPEQLVVYRVHATNQSHDRPRLRSDLFPLLDRALDRIVAAQRDP